jgi:protein-ribulosamine 3-kinase
MLVPQRITEMRRTQRPSPRLSKSTSPEFIDSLCNSVELKSSTSTCLHKHTRCTEKNKINLNYSEITKVLSSILHTSPTSISYKSVAGGSINQCHKITAGGHLFFCKLNDEAKFPNLFIKESHGLEALSSVHVIRTPKIETVVADNGIQVLLMEWIEQGRKTDLFWKTFGEQLANLHRITRSQHGFYEDNYMGALPQSNAYNDNWIDFFIQHRLSPQIEMAVDHHLLQSKHTVHFERLFKRLPELISTEPASLLHGDLWSGNFLCDKGGCPVLIDPAVYYGNRNMDLAMTTLFGGFDEAFYESYRHHYPFPPNHLQQWDICNLYPLLIHLNLFGSGYLSSITSVIHQF